MNPPENAAPIGPVAHSVLPVCDRPNSTADLVFRAQPEFDRNLSNALHSTRPVIVDVAEPYDQRSPPPAALEPWLSEVRSAGGAVTLSPYCASGGRGLGQGWFSDFVQHLTRSIYKPAKRYNVTLYADASRRRITQIAFRPRTAPMAVQN